MATCSKHSGQPYVMVCNSCDKSDPFVCCHCIAKDHKGHDLEPFDIAANIVLDTLKREKLNQAPKLKELHIQLKSFETIRENESKISENTKKYIKRRRDLLKQAIDDEAKLLLEKQESSHKRMLDVLVYGKQQTEDQVKNILDSQSKLASIEISANHQEIIQIGKRIHFPDISNNPCPIPAVTRHSLEQENNVDRKLIRGLFGEETESPLMNWYIQQYFDGKEDCDTESIATVSTTYLFDEDKAKHLEDSLFSIDSQDADSDGNVGRSFSNCDLPMPTTCHRQEIPQPSPTTSTWNQTTRSRDLTSSTTTSEQGLRQDNSPAKTTSLETFVPQDQKQGPEASTACTSECKSKIMRLSRESIGLVSANATFDNFDIMPQQSHSIIETDLQNDVYV